MKQLGMGTGFENDARARRREELVAKVAGTVPRSEPWARIELHIPKASDGRLRKNRDMRCWAFSPWVLGQVREGG
jgi:hypothetical protein